MRTLCHIRGCSQAKETGIVALSVQYAEVSAEVAGPAGHHNDVRTCPVARWSCSRATHHCGFWLRHICRVQDRSAIPERPSIHPDAEWAICSGPRNELLRIEPRLGKEQARGTGRSISQFGPFSPPADVSSSVDSEERKPGGSD